MEFVKENWIELSLIIVAVIAILFNITEVNKEKLSFGSPTTRQLANMISIVFSTLFGAALGYAVYSGSVDDFLAPVVILGTIAGLGNAFSLAYFFNMIQA